MTKQGDFEMICDTSYIDNHRNIPRKLKKKFAGKKIKFRLYSRCKGFFIHHCYQITTKGEVADVEEMEEYMSGRYTYDGARCYYFESSEDATWFRLKYGI